MNTIIQTLTDVLRDPQGLVERHDHPAGLAATAPTLLAIIVASGALFGSAVGVHHGGVQMLYAALKLPVLLLLPPLVTLPAIHAAQRLSGAPVPWRRLSLAGLVGTARTALLAAALSPVLWLPFSSGLDYHLSVLLFAGALVLVGLPGMLTVLRVLPSGGDRRGLLALGALAVLGVTFAQAGWLLRPFVARPSAEVTLLRPIEENVFSSLSATRRSAAGDYCGWETESSGLLGRPGARTRDGGEDR